MPVNTATVTWIDMLMSLMIVTLIATAGRVDGQLWFSSISSPKSLTCWLQAPHPGNRLSWRAKPYEGVVFTLHHWVDELLNAANGQGRGGSRDPTAKCNPSQGILVG